MAQIIGLVIVLIIAKLIVDQLKGQLNHSKPSKKSGDIIDISDSWVDTGSLPYQKKMQVMTPKGIALYHNLAEVLAGSDYIIAPHLHMSELIAVTDSLRQQEYLQRLKERNLDLAVLEALTFKPVLVINFTDGDVGRKQQLSNTFTYKAVKAADLPQLDINLNNPPAGQALLSELRKQGLKL
jgi:hypothetical protein